jgi:RHS repeat-associated protein
MCSVLPLGVGTEGISQFAYELDKQGKKISATENFWTDIDDDGTLDLLANYVNWKYDNAGRLIREVFDYYDDNFDQTSEWIYDLVGNRFKQTVNGKDTTYNYDANDRLLKEVTNNKTTIYGYDHTQQTSKQVSENGEIVSTTTYEYDLQGRMSVVTIISGNKTEITKYEYGADGIRVSAEHEIYVDGELQSKIRTEYLNDSKSLTGYSQVLRQTEYDSEENVIKTISYVIGHQRISQTVEIGGEKTTYYFTFDGHGSARVLLDTAMVVAQIYSFDAYGNALGFNTAEALTEFLYSGEQFDSKIGQQYLRARYYDPATGRFNRLDPFFGNVIDPLSLHNYLYAHSDPTNGIDPSGEVLFLLPIIGLISSITVGATIGGLTGAYLSGNVTGTLTGALVGAILFPSIIYAAPVLTFAAVGTYAIAGAGVLTALASLASIVNLFTDSQSVLEFMCGINLFLRSGLGYLAFPLSYVSHFSDNISMIDHTATNIHPSMHDSWVPGMQQAVFGREDVKMVINQWKEELTNRFITNNYQNVLNGKKDLCLDSGVHSPLQAMLGTITLEYYAVRDPITNEVTITWYCHDVIDANSFSERPESNLSTSHRLEAGGDLVYDNFLQAWYNFRVSKQEVIKL